MRDASDIRAAKIKPFKETKQLLVKKRNLLETKGAQADKQMAELRDRVQALGKNARENFPLDDAQSRSFREAGIDRHRQFIYNTLQSIYNY